MVEVCRSRAAILYDEKPQEEGSSRAPQSNSMSLTCAAFLFSQTLSFSRASCTGIGGLSITCY